MLGALLIVWLSFACSALPAGPEVFPSEAGRVAIEAWAAGTSDGAALEGGGVLRGAPAAWRELSRDLAGNSDGKSMGGPRKPRTAELWYSRAVSPLRIPVWAGYALPSNAPPQGPPMQARFW
jgi:hypothetical protein